MHRFAKWRDALGLAPDPQTVSRLISEYVEGIPPEQIARLPAECRRILSDPTPDLQDAAFTLLQTEMAYSGEETEAVALLHEIAHTFAAASVRLTQLHGRQEMPTGN